MRLGQTVYWIETDRPATGSAWVYMKCAKFFRADGDAVAVLLDFRADVPGELVLRVLTRPLLFTDFADAQCHAFGTAVRLIRAFKYPSVAVSCSDGTVEEFKL